MYPEATQGISSSHNRLEYCSHGAATIKEPYKACTISCRAQESTAGQGRAGQGRAGQAYMVKGLAQLVALGLVHGLEALSKGHVGRRLVALVGSAVLVLAGEILMHRNGVLYPLQQA